MNDFQVYFKLGFEHILDVYGYDHMLFLLVLLCNCKYSQWKTNLIFLSGFTIGHFISMLITFSLNFQYSTYLIELFIPTTIIITATFNLINSSNTHKIKSYTSVFFGCIHGLGFASYLAELLSKKANLLSVLLYFNMGVEIGQIVFASFLMLIFFILYKFFGISTRIINLLFSLFSIAIALLLLINRF